MKSVFDKDFRYVPSLDTDVKKTFARIRKEQEAQRKQEEENEREAKQKTVAMRRF